MIYKIENEFIELNEIIYNTIGLQVSLIKFYKCV